MTAPAVTLRPIFPREPTAPAPDPGASWVGQVDETQLDGLADRGARIVLAGASGLSRARLAVRRGPVLRGFVEVDVHDGTLDADALRELAAALPEPGPDRGHGADVPVSVVLCSRDRPGPLRDALVSLLRLDHPDFEVVVVDNSADPTGSRALVDGLADERLVLVHEPRPGLSRARNAGLVAARHEVVAFTDDDVVVDRWWLRAVAAPFADGTVACVCGIVPSGELLSAAQRYFDERVTWARNCTPTRYSLDAPPAGHPLFPFEAGLYGTGANFAVRRADVLRLGGFDEALGAGSPSGGGEDVDVFVAVVLAGRTLAYAPDAVVWHRHRASWEELLSQSRAYGRGLGAWLTKIALSPRTAVRFLPRAGAAARHARSLTPGSHPAGNAEADRRWRSRASREEFRHIVRGPGAYLGARVAGARVRPLAGLAAAAPHPPR
ncbi:glycosyltransferase family 2 protein [Kineococcus sp. SYSU DK003]|uniref:glycosyltransferase n=1 Tax=Kineococcus sp. SYSU DK003 TaxID=3383124 RepID=UPI003D7C6E33